MNTEPSSHFPPGRYNIYTLITPLLKFENQKKAKNQRCAARQVVNRERPKPGVFWRVTKYVSPPPLSVLWYCSGANMGISPPTPPPPLRPFSSHFLAVSDLSLPHFLESVVGARIYLQGGGEGRRKEDRVIKSQCLFVGCAAVIYLFGRAGRGGEGRGERGQGI